MAFTDDGEWWDEERRSRLKNEIDERCDDPLSTFHSVVVGGLTPGIPYQARIRSSNRQPGLEERIWGDVVAFVP